MDPAVLLDVDGTLADTVWLHTVAWKEAFRRAGVDVASHRIHPLVGMGADRLVAEIVGAADERIADLHLEEHLARRDLIRPLPGARALVRLLHERGARSVLATSASGEELDVLRTALDVDDWVAGWTSSDDAERSKPDPDIFAAALELVGGPDTPAVVVGDTRWDVEAGRALDLPVVGLTTGGAREAELRAAGAVEVCADPVALTAAVADGLVERLVG